MKRNIEKHFLLLIFIFAISLVNITSTFALGKIEALSDVKKNPTTKGKEDPKVCKRDDTQIGIDQYSATCRTQCTSKDVKFAQFKRDNKVACDFLAVADRSAASGAQKEKPKEKPKDPENSSLTEDYIKNADLSTKEAFDKIKEVFYVTVARFTHTDLNKDGAPIFKNESLFTQYIGDLGLVPVRVTITPKAVDLDATKQVLLEELTQRILALVAKAPITLGEDADEHAAPAPWSLYEAIYKGAVAGFDKTIIQHINTKTGVSIELKDSTVGAIVNTAKVIAVRKGPSPDTAIDILLELDAPGYVSRFEKLSGVTFSYAHIANLDAKGAAFVAPENFKEGLIDDTKAITLCKPAPGKFFAILKANPGCRNLLKITVPTATTAEFGIPAAPLFDSGDSAAHIQAAAKAAKTVGFTIVQTGVLLLPFATYFDPDAAQEDDHYLYASQAIRDQLKSSSVITNFTKEFWPSHYWPASEHVQAALATLPIAGGDANSIISLLRVTGDLRSVYLTKEIRERSK